MSEPIPPRGPELPPAPPRSEVESGAVGGPEPAHGRPRARLVVALVGALALVVVAVDLATLGGGGSPAAARPLAFSFTPGDRQTYELHLTMDGTLSAGDLGEMPFDAEATEVASWEVTGVDADGVATVEVTVSEVSGSLNGAEMPSDPSEFPSLEMRIAPDGRVLEWSGPSFFGADPSSGASFPGMGPGMGQMTPLLADHPVAPGDRWTTSFSQANPFGEGGISYEGTGTFVREEELDGVRAAVIRTETTATFDLTVALDELLAAMGEDLVGSHGAEQLRGVEVAYQGRGSYTGTGWVDLDASLPLKAIVSGNVDTTMTVVAGVDALSGLPFALRADLTLELRRRG